MKPLYLAELNFYNFIYKLFKPLIFMT